MYVEVGRKSQYIGLKLFDNGKEVIQGFVQDIICRVGWQGYVDVEVFIFVYIDFFDEVVFGIGWVLVY